MPSAKASICRPACPVTQGHKSRQSNSLIQIKRCEIPNKTGPEPSGGDPDFFGAEPLTLYNQM